MAKVSLRSVTCQASYTAGGGGSVRSLPGYWAYTYIVLI